MSVHRTSAQPSLDETMGPASRQGLLPLGAQPIFALGGGRGELLPDCDLVPIDCYLPCARVFDVVCVGYTSGSLDGCFRRVRRCIRRVSQFFFFFCSDLVLGSDQKCASRDAEQRERRVWSERIRTLFVGLLQALWPGFVPGEFEGR